MSLKPEKFEGSSANIAEEQKAKLKLLFPEVFTDGGRIDFERLKLTLGETVDTGKERYGMNWPGKAECFRTIQKPSMATLVPAPEESVDFDSTENLIIEGDNLETLKLLQKSYLGKVKMIYIDPPYNTGNDFIYPDNYSESLETYLQYTGQVDAEGRKFSTNTEADGRFHSKWLNMMYPRLFLARNLLREDGVIFISIDDHEADNLRKLCNEIFGEECFAGQVAVVNNLKGRNDRKHLATAHEYVLVYARSEFETLGLPLTSKQLAEYKEADELGGNFQWRDLRKRGGADTRSARPKLYFPVYANPETGACSMDKSGNFSVEIFPTKSDGTDGCWRWGLNKVKQAVPTLKASKVENKNRWNVSYRVYLEQDGQERVSKPKSVWMGPELSTDAATKTLKALIAELSGITPKPVELLKVIVQQSLDEDDICLDFFAGSGTTAQAVLEWNKEDGGNRRFILVQLPEPTELKDFPTIADITKERVRRVIHRLKSSNDEKLNLQSAKFDSGFKVFKLQSSNFKAWNSEQPKDDAELAKQLTLHVDHLVPGRKQEDVLFELLLKSGFPLTTKIEKIALAGKDVFSIADGAMLICLEKDLTSEVIKAIADKKPERVVCLDAGFSGNDQLKTNAVQTMRAKGVTKFQTV